jgi:polysaccharide export outer membrane protein
MNARMGLDSGRRLFAACALIVGCTTASAQYIGPAISSTSTVANAPSSTSKPDYGDSPIMPGDVISIITYGVPELTTTSLTTTSDSLIGASAPVVSGLKVGAQGEITLAYLGTIKIAGLTPSEAVSYLSRRLVEGGFLVDPQISVALVESPTRVITVVGEVVKPAPVPAFGRVRLLEVISACGGFTQMASHTITLRRLGNPNPIPIELGVDPKTTDVTNILLLAGDTIIVPRVGNVFVVGEVKNSEAIPLSTNTPITVMRAIAMAGGLKYSAALSKARIIRTTADNQVLEIKLDLKKLMLSQQVDVALLSDDVLFIPANTFKATISSGGASVAASALYGFAYIAK